MLTPEKIQEFKTLAEASNGDGVFFIADAWEKAVSCLGALRNLLGKEMKLASPDELAFLWVVDFPMFEVNEEGETQAVHHPFTRPLNDEHLALMRTDKLKAKADTYDLVLNGYEMGGGSIRIHERALQEEVFAILGLTPEGTEKKFGHLLKAFQYGVPPHGGTAFGIERIIMILADEPNIREVIAFPKNQKAKDLMMGAPTPLPDKILKEQHIQVRGE